MQQTPAVRGQPPGADRRTLLLLAVPAATGYFVLGLVGDLRAHLMLFFALHALLLAAMFAAWRRVRADHRSLPVALGAALLFRLVATPGEPALSDDLYRYLWDGRLQLHGVHPYLHAPDDESVAALRDAGWEKINHPQVKTIYPPLAQAFFLLLAALGAGPVGAKLALGLLDFGVVLALARLLARAGLPRDRVLLYAWNPLAVLETAGSGHIEPLGVLLLVLACGGLLGSRSRWPAVALAASVQVKLLPLVLVPGHLRRNGWKAALAFTAALLLIGLPYALAGPALGPGLADYAERWEHNAFVFAGLRELSERIDTAARLKPLIEGCRERFGDQPLWNALHGLVWPGEVTRILAALALAATMVGVMARRLTDPLREASLLIGTVLLLSPTVHPWYVLWLLPFAAARLSYGWLVFAAAVPLAYCAGEGDVPWILRSVEYLPALGLLIAGAWKARARPAPITVC